MSELFRRLETILEEKLPIEIEKILVHAGFDTKNSLLELNQDSIKQIEDHVNENKFLLEGTVYEHILRQNLNFKFKPGHKALIFSLPKLISNKIKSTKKRKVESELETTESDQTNTTVEKSQLISTLIQKIYRFAEKLSFEVILNETHISDFRQENQKVKCNIKCPVCKNPTQCTYVSYWMISNFQRHLKQHFKIALSGEESENNTEAEKPLLFSVAQQSKLDDILNE